MGREQIWARIRMQQTSPTSDTPPMSLVLDDFNGLAARQRRNMGLLIFATLTVQYFLATITQHS
jgi:hypothetical protein